MSNQTTVASRIVNATPGLIADINQAKLISRAAEGGVIPFGVIVSVGTGENQAVLGGDATGVLGVTGRSVGKEAATIGATTLDYQPTEAMQILQGDYIFIKCSLGASDGDVVKFVNATGALESNTANAAAAGETVMNQCRFQGDVVPGGVGKIYVESVNALTAGS